MNLLLLSPEEVAADGLARLTGRRARHAREVLGVSVDDTLRVGVRHGQLGEGRVVHSAPDSLVLAVTLERSPPPRAGLGLLLAMPRPKALKRILFTVASLGIDRVALVNAAKVERSYFDSKVLDPAFLAARLDEGLEQVMDTVPPTLEVFPRFRPFVEDALEGFFGPGPRLLAHPAAAASLPKAAPGPGPGRLVLAVGPEGGWVPFELELLGARGFVPFSLGSRVLRVETAVPLLLGQVLLLRAGQATGRSGEGCA